MSVVEDHPEGVTYGSRRVARVDAQPPDGGKGPCSTPEGSRISMSDRGIAKVSATPAGVGMVGPADRWLLAGARNHRLPYATPSGSIPPDTHLRGAVLNPKSRDPENRVQS